jgi:hypothetical protein
MEFCGSMKQEYYFFFWKSFNFIAKFVVLMFFLYFHNWIKVLNLDMSIYKWKFFISISFMMCLIHI